MKNCLSQRKEQKVLLLDQTLDFLKKEEEAYDLLIQETEIALQEI